MATRVEDFTGVKAAVFHNDQILIYRRDNKPEIPFPNMLDFPGGGREGGETLYTCLYREIREECAIAIGADQIVWRRMYPSLSDPSQSVYFCAVQISRGQAKAMVPGNEGQKWKFIDANTLFNHPQMIPYLQERLLDYFSNEKVHWLEIDVVMDWVRGLLAETRKEGGRKWQEAPERVTDLTFAGDPLWREGKWMRTVIQNGPLASSPRYAIEMVALPAGREKTSVELEVFECRSAPKYDALLARVSYRKKEASGAFRRLALLYEYAVSRPNINPRVKKMHENITKALCDGF